MQLFVSIILFMFVHLVSAKTHLQVQKNAESEVASQQLQQIYEQSKHMKYGKCWTKALEQLRTGCRSLTDKMQRRIAYAFARCHLQSAGRDIPECQENVPISECTSEDVLKDSAFNTYTEFFTHTQQICFHLQSQVWHESTENTISRLADNSAEVATSLEQSSQIAQEMMSQQNATLKNQEVLLKNEQLLRENMHKSVLDVKRSHEETKTIIREQRVLFAEVFDRVAALQKTVLGEFTSVYTFGYYVGAALLAYILTSTTRTSGARIWLFVELTCNFLMERAIVNYHMASGSIIGLPENTVMPETVYRDMWTCRKSFSMVAMITMFVCMIRYKDYNKINNQLLEEIKRQNLELQTLLKENGVNATATGESMMQTPVKASNAKQAESAFPAIEGHHHENSVQQQIVAVNDQMITTLTSNVTDTSCSTMTSVLHSHFDSEDDQTFIADDSFGSDTSYSSSYRSASGSSRRSSPGGRELKAMITSFRRSSTPQRELESPLAAPRLSSSSKKRSRRSSTASDLSIIDQLNDSVANVEGLIVGGHNLRRRRSVQGLNPILERESAKDFAMAVAKVNLERQRIFS